MKPVPSRWSGHAGEASRRQEASGVDTADIELHSARTDARVGFRVLAERNEHTVLPQDAGLFRCDLAQRVAQVLHVVHGDVGNDRYRRLDNVGGVEAAAQTDLQNRKLNLLLCEVDEGDGSEQLEEAGIVRELAACHKLLGGAVHQREDASEVFIGDFLKRAFGGRGNADAFIHSQQMRRGVEARAKPCGPCNGRERGTGGALAVSAGDEHGGKGSLRRAQRREQRADQLQRKLAGLLAGCYAQLRTELRKLLYGVRVTHRNSKASSTMSHGKQGWNFPAPGAMR